MNLAISFQSEMLKTKRAVAFYLCFVGAAVIPFVFLLNAIFGDEGPSGKNNDLDNFIQQGFSFMSIVICPFFIMLMCTMLAQIEVRNNTWKQVFTSPQPVFNIFLARFLNVQFMLLLFLVLFNVFMGLALVIVHFILPSMHLLNQPFNGNAWIMFNVKTYLAVLAITAIQFWLGLRFRNFIIPLGIGFVLWWAGMLMAMEFHTPNSQYFPYSFLVYSFSPKYKDIVPQIQLTSVLYTVVVLGLAFLDFRRGKR